MTTKMIALAGALVISVSGFALAQNSGTTIVPQGQNAGSQNAQGQASQGQAAGGQNAAADSGGGSSAPAAAAPSGGNADTAAAAGGNAAEPAAEPAGASGGAQMAEAADPEKMKPDAHPSKDTATEGNTATEGDLGKYVDPAGNPTYIVGADGKADWYAWRGYKKYMANCMQCHGPDGLGSSFAPNLVDQLQDLSYYDFAGIIVSGQQNKWNPSGNSIMPAWGEDPNVMCSMDAIYIYLRARADGVVGRGEPKRIANNKPAQEEEYSCLGF